MPTSNGYVLDPSPTRYGGLVPVPDSERDDRDALWTRLRAEGYLFLTGFLDPALVLEFRRFYFGTLAAAGVTMPGTAPELGVANLDDIDRAAFRRLLFDVIVPSPEYQALCEHRAIRSFFEWLYGDDVHLHRRKILRHNGPEDRGVGSATQAHYDLVYLREGTDRVLSMWIPLGDIPLARGGLTYLERSHLRVLKQEAEAALPAPAASITADLPSLADRYDSRWLTTDYAAGDVVVHSAHLVHAGIDNTDPDRIMRLSTDIRYQSLGDPIDWRWQEHWRDDDGL